MKLAIVVGAVAAATAAIVCAQEAPGRMAVSKTSTQAELAALLPPRAVAEKVGGNVGLECVISTKGELTDCNVVSEEPLGYGFGEAALKAARNDRIKTKDDKGQPVAGRTIRRGYSFLAPGDANPDWARQPTSDELASVYPAAAMKEGLNGRASLSCGVTIEGFLANCKVASEAPAGKGFGAAALALSPQFRMTPKIRNGQPVAATVTIPVVWSEMKQMKGSDRGPGRIHIVLDPPWTATPTAEDMKDAWPAKSTENAATASVRCRLTAKGDVRLCEITSESPRRQGFGRAAQKLAEQKFTVRVDLKEGERFDDYSVDIPFRFRNPSEPDTRVVTRPKWIRTLSAESVALVFPKAATEAGLSQGRGTINCLVETTGTLSDCRIVSEEPAGLGFGAAAVEVAKYMTMNPWSFDGDPLGGLRVTLPIRLVLTDPEPEAAPAPAQ